MTNPQIVDRSACLKQVSYADRKAAMAVAQGVALKTAQAIIVVGCSVCHGFHIQKKGEL